MLSAFDDTFHQHITTSNFYFKIFLNPKITEANDYIKDGSLKVVILCDYFNLLLDYLIGVL